KIGFFDEALTIVPWYAAGRNPAAQLAGPFGANPRESGRTTNDGRLSFRLPRPHETHAPKLGEPASPNPERSRKLAGPRTIDCEPIAGRKAISSTHPARYGTRSLIHLPHSP